MPAGRKQKHKATFAKPAGGAYVHPSLASGPGGAAASSSTPPPSTVNERIQFLRRTQSPRQALTSADILESTHTHAPPSLAASRHARSLPFHLNRRVAGPPPPRSWIEDRNDPKIRYGETTDTEKRYPVRLDYFPGGDFLPEDTLLHQGLKALARNIDWHLEYDHVYLSVLPIATKELLFSYVARYGPHEGLSLRALKTICSSAADTELPESTGGEELHRLDLAGSMGRALAFKQLAKFWTARPASVTDGAPQTPKPDIPETWDDIEEPVTHSQSSIPPFPSTTLRFPQLTHLSLSHPDPSVSWTDLLSFTPQLTNLTHLSLAHWPSPAPSTSLQQNPTDLRPATVDVDGTATGVYRLWRLSKTTSSLRYLDLRGCHAWFYLLMCTTSATSSPAHSTTSASTPQLIESRPDRYRRNRIDFDADSHHTSRASRQTRVPIGADWASAWLGVSGLNLAQDYLPKGIQPPILASLYLSRGRTGNYSYPALSGDVPVVRAGTGTGAAATAGVGAGPGGGSTTGPGVVANPGEPLAPSPQRPPQEDEGSYRIIVADAKMGEQMAERKRAKRWVEGEIEGTRLERWVRGQRKEGIVGRGRRAVEALRVEFGWDKERLVERGYEEQALFEAGL